MTAGHVSENALYHFFKTMMPLYTALGKIRLGSLVQDYFLPIFFCTRVFFEEQT